MAKRISPHLLLMGVLSMAMTIVARDSHAAIVATFANDEPGFLAAIQPGYYLENFNITPNVHLPNSLSYSTNGFSYDISAPNDLYSIPAGGGAMSTWDDGDLLTITFTSNNVTAVGGYFFLNDNGGNFYAGSVTVKFSDNTVQVINQTAGPNNFYGFISDNVGIQSLTVAGPGPNTTYYPGVDHLYVGAVPEPTSLIVWSLLGLTIGGAGLWRRRKRA